MPHSEYRNFMACVSCICVNQQLNRCRVGPDCNSINDYYIIDDLCHKRLNRLPKITAQLISTYK